MQGYIDCHLCVNKTQSDDVVGGDWDIQFWGGQCLADKYVPSPQKGTQLTG